MSGDPHYADYFIEMDPAADLSAGDASSQSAAVDARPRQAAGTRHVWTTFSADQVDLNYANPHVLLDMLDVLLFYIQQGARFIRLDAIAYLWKRVGTSLHSSCRRHMRW